MEISSYYKNKRGIQSNKEQGAGTFLVLPGVKRGFEK